MQTVYDEHTLQEFVAENRDHLEEIEPDLLSLEREGSNTAPEIVHRVFRAVHSIKGSSGFFHFPAIKELSHVMENVLALIREDRLEPNAGCVDALLAGVDKLRIMFAEVQQSDQVPYQEELDRLNGILKTPSSPCEIPPSLPCKEEDGLPDPGIVKCSAVPDKDGGLTFFPSGESSLPPARFDADAKKEIHEAQHEGHYLYVVWPSEDRNGAAEKEPLAENLREYGKLFLGHTLSEPTRSAHLFATVMEQDLLCEAFELPEERILALEDVSLNPAEPCEPPAPTPSAPCPEPPLRSSSVNASAGTSPNEGNGSSPYETIRVNVELIDTLMNLAGELVLGRNQLRKALDSADSASPMLDTLVQNVDVVTSEVQEKIMQMRMQPVGNLFNKYRRVVRDLSRDLNKEVGLVMEGREVELDKSILEGLSDPMTHLIRNALDHGIEDPEEREAAGKPRRGTLRLLALHEGGQVSISITDDGRGIDPERIAAKAVERGTLSPDEVSSLSGKEKQDLIFRPGFSTADDVSDISGRGVGMDVVRTNIEALGGHLEVESENGRGSAIRIRLPLTLAIIPSLLVGAGGHRFAIPQINVKELICVRAGEVASRIEGVSGAEVLRVRGSLLPLVRLTDVLGLTPRYLHGETGEWKRDRRRRLADRREGNEGEEGALLDAPPEDRRGMKDRRQSWHSDLYVVVLKLGENRFGLCVEELFDTEEIVVKPLSDHLKGIKCFAGATIMGDGALAMILDTAGIAERQGLRFKDITAEERRRRQEVASRAQSDTRERLSVLVFNGASDEHFAFPLQYVSRLEKVDPNAVHRIGEQEYMDFRGDSLPLIRLDRYLPVSPLPPEPDSLHVIIPKTGHRLAGILVSNILDILEITPNFQETEARGPGVLGSVFLDGCLTLFLNAEELLAFFDEENPRLGASRNVEAT